MTIPLHKILLFVIVFLLGSISLEIVDARAPKILILTGSDAAPYKETREGFLQYLRKQGMQVDVEIYTLKDGTAQNKLQALQEANKREIDLIFTLGNSATASALERSMNVPIIFGLVLRADKTIKPGRATGVTLEFPLETQIEMLRRILPAARTIGVLYNPKENQEIIDSAVKLFQKTGLKLNAQRVTVPQDLPAALDYMAKNVDVLWGIPDTLVLNAQTAKQILLFSYRNRIPLVGISPEWVKAGALYSLEWDFTDIGAQCGDMALKIMKGTSISTLPPASPRKVLYSVSAKTIRYMKVDVPEAMIRQAYHIYDGEISGAQVNR
jgi:putative ABC transport system substrate-binding protein